MKRRGNLYHKVWDFENLLCAARNAQRGKRFRAGCRDFNLDLEKNLLGLQDELRSRTYRPGSYRTFRIFEPKQRLISAAPYRDRVVHHALVNVIEPVFERGMIEDSYANRVGRGTLKAVERFTDFSRRRAYVLKMDIVKYFPSIDHALLTAACERKIKDRDVLRMIGIILASGEKVGEDAPLAYFSGDDLLAPLARKRGLPIGNLTSQLFANVYLDGFDHFVKETVPCRCYIRYMDDLAVFDDDKARLHDMRAAMIERLEGLCLRVHENKAQIWPVVQGTDWLGYRIYPTHRRLRKSCIRRFRERLKGQVLAYGRYEADLKDIGASLASWIGYSRHADSYQLRGRILEDTVFQRGRA